MQGYEDLPTKGKSVDPYGDIPVSKPSGGAAFGVYPRQRATPSRPETKEALKQALEKTAEALGFSVPEEPEFSPSAVGASAGMGAAAGAFGPKALQMAGKGLSMIPTVPTRAAGTLSQTLGTALGSIPTTKRTVGAGGIMGGSELAGQAGEQLGIPRAISEPVAVLGAPKAAKAVGGALVGTPSATSEKYARAAEALGFKLSPAQVRQDIPVPAKGPKFLMAAEKENQDLANKLASSATGKEAKEIGPDFIRERLSSLGKEFDKVYKGRDFVIDPQAAQIIDQIAKNEMQLPSNAAVSAVKNTANTITENFNAMMRRPGAKPGTFMIEGDALQRLRTDLMQAARSSTSRQDAHAIYELVDVIDQSVARNHPQIAATLSELRPLYRNTIILEDLTRSGGIKQGNISLEKLGNMLGGRKSGIRTGERADIDQLGEMGRMLQLRARWETEGRAATAGEDLLGQLLGTGADIAGRITGLRSSAARAIQRQLGE
jgi:hypothetical protein